MVVQPSAARVIHRFGDAAFADHTLAGVAAQPEQQQDNRGEYPSAKAGCRASEIFHEANKLYFCNVLAEGEVSATGT
jgi:hypothetical protein